MPEDKPKIEYDDFAKLDIRIGTITAAELVPDTDKLIRCTVDFGDFGTRTIISGIAQWKKPEELIGRQFPYIVNLEPRVIRSIESQGMILAVGVEDGIALLNPDKDVTPGSCIR
jgi:methionyl-tRNA synthetase